MFRLRRRPGEGQAQYNQRTAHWLRKCFSQSQVPLICHRVLRAIYKAAWQESHSGLPLDMEPLKWAREFKSQLWWETMCGICSVYQRHKQGIKHHKSGHKAAWEDLFCALLGIHWRSARDACSCIAEWMAGCTDFVISACEHFGIWIATQPGSLNQLQFTLSSPKQFSHFAEAPVLPRHPEDHFWDSFQKRLWIQVDCKGIAEVSNGEAALTAHRLEPIFRRLVNKCYCFYSNGWLPRRNIDNFIIWARREYNTVADHYANAAMDNNCGWEWRDCSRVSETASFKICVDGGLRGSSLDTIRPASMGCAIYVAAQSEQSTDAQYYPVCFAAQPLHDTRSAFQAEAMAIEWCLSVFESLFQ